MRRAFWALLLLTGILAGISAWMLAPRSAAPVAPLPGLDTGMTATALRTWDPALMADWARTQPWLRIRGHPFPKDRPEAVRREAMALRELSAAGFKPIILLRWGENSWANGIRPGGGQRLPLDLREAYERGFTEGQRFGATGAAFEIENEPDISFVQDNAETFMAFQKAVYLGVKAGAAGAANIQRSTSNIQHPNYGPKAGPKVVMAPLALPPGPYFEQLVANGLFSYTDAFNYHYYGYAEDFAGVYGQFEAAVNDVGLPLGARRSAGTKGTAQGLVLRSENKTLPVLLTEYGYGALGKDARNTVEGRVRQWRWFKAVGEDIVRLRIAGPMAFYLPPYLERDQLEFGLTGRGAAAAATTAAEHPTSNIQHPTSNYRSPASNVQQSTSDAAYRAGGLAFAPRDFQAEEVAPWMRRIGERFGENEAMPALAWLMDEGARRPYVPKDWAVTAPPPSPVVVDFIAGDGLAQAKRYGGYVAQRVSPKPAPAPATKPAPPPAAPKAEIKPPAGPPPLPWPGLAKGYVPPPAWYGTGAVVLYNFSAKPVTGHLEIERGHDVVVDPTMLVREWTLAPMSRTVVEINVRIPAQTFARQELTVRFERGGSRSEHGRTVGRSDGIAPAIFSTAFFPNYPLMRETVAHDFAQDVGLPLGARRSAGTDGTAQGPALQRASEEPALEPQGCWRVTPGVTVEEAANKVWRFHIERFPDEPEKSAIAELPLPAGFAFPDRAQLRFFYRLAQPAGTDVKTGKYLEAYFRTANGNLYQVWPRQLAMHTWSEYIEAKENYTMAFYGRANLPWRFKDNQPVALVFFFRPRDALPAVYEVKDARVVELGR